MGRRYSLTDRDRRAAKARALHELWGDSIGIENWNPRPTSPRRFARAVRYYARYSRRTWKPFGRTRRKP